MARIITIAATQMACTWDVAGNAARAEAFGLEAMGSKRACWGPFLDRRPDLYSSLATHGEIAARA